MSRAPEAVDSVVRRATVADVPLMLPLVQQYWLFEDLDGFEPAAVASQLERLLSAPGLGAGWLAVDDGVVLGYLLVVLVFSLEHLGLTGEIDELYVVPSGRGRGIGAMLVKAAETDLSLRGCTNISLQLALGNKAAGAFYRRAGYTKRSGFELLEKDLPSGPIL